MNVTAQQVTDIVPPVLDSDAFADFVKQQGRLREAQGYRIFSVTVTRRGRYVSGYVEWEKKR